MLLDTWLPKNVSTFQDIDALFRAIFYLTGVVFIGVIGAMVFFLIKYRAQPGRKAEYIHGHTTLEIVWTSATTLIVFTLAMISLPKWNRIKAEIPPSNVVIQVTGKQFNWEILYPGPDGEFGTEDDLQLDNEMHAPVNEVVKVHLTSKDVIHSFFVPHMRVKQDALPGRFVDLWFKAVETGVYEIPCAELCGFGHSGMKGRLTVEEPQAYALWLKEKYGE
jgi:cytochrome c oxidase subunit 2